MFLKCIQSGGKFNESVDVLKLNSHLDSSTSQNNSNSNSIKKPQWSKSIKKRLNRKMQHNKKQTIVKQKVSYYDSYINEIDEDDDEDSDMSFENLSFYRSFNNDDLNSSLSSVSSLEFEPFETISTMQKKNIQVRIKSTSSFSPTQSKLTKFVPISSSSRSNLLLASTSATMNKSSKKFQPFTTSSRRSLLIPIEERSTLHSPKMTCSICMNEDDCSRGVEYFVSQQNIVNNICSSTLISLGGNGSRQTSQISLVNCSLVSSCTATSISSTNSSISSKNCSYC